jgi:hypothetical protein
VYCEAIKIKYEEGQGRERKLNGEDIDLYLSMYSCSSVMLTELIAARRSLVKVWVLQNFSAV